MKIVPWFLLPLLMNLFVISSSEAGDVETTPAYNTLGDGTYVIDAGPNSDGTTTVIFKAVSSDSTFNVSGTFPLASTYNGDFPSGSPTQKTVIYSSSASGSADSVTLTITTADAGGTCTAFYMPHLSFEKAISSSSSNPFASISDRHLTSLLINVSTDVFPFLANIISSPGRLLSLSNPTNSQQIHTTTMHFKVNLAKNRKPRNSSISLFNK